MDAKQKLNPEIPESLREIFIYHTPEADQVEAFSKVTEASIVFAQAIIDNCPPSADRSDAIRKVREARMTANASIALRGRA